MLCWSLIRCTFKRISKPPTNSLDLPMVLHLRRLTPLHFTNLSISLLLFILRLTVYTEVLPISARQWLTLVIFMYDVVCSANFTRRSHSMAAEFWRISFRSFRDLQRRMKRLSIYLFSDYRISPLEPFILFPVELLLTIKQMVFIPNMIKHDWYRGVCRNQKVILHILFWQLGLS